EADEIDRIVEPPPSLLVGPREPALADDRKQHAARGHLLLDDAAKVAARLDARHIHEHDIFSEPLGEVTEKPAGLAFRVLPSIADKNRSHRASPPTHPKIGAPVSIFSASGVSAG